MQSSSMSRFRPTGNFSPPKRSKSRQKVLVWKRERRGLAFCMYRFHLYFALFSVYTSLLDLRLALTKKPWKKLEKHSACSTPKTQVFCLKQFFSFSRRFLCFEQGPSISRSWRHASELSGFEHFSFLQTNHAYLSCVASRWRKASCELCSKTSTRKTPPWWPSMTFWRW